jgi:hypothetical protein
MKWLFYLFFVSSFLLQLSDSVPGEAVGTKYNIYVPEIFVEGHIILLIELYYSTA